MVMYNKCRRRICPSYFKTAWKYPTAMWMIFKLQTTKELEKDGLFVDKTSNFQRVIFRDKTRKENPTISFISNISVKIKMMYLCLPFKPPTLPWNARNILTMSQLKRLRIWWSYRKHSLEKLSLAHLYILMFWKGKNIEMNPSKNFLSPSI